MSLSDGIIACWDAGGKRSYPGTGTTWYDIVGGDDGTITNSGTNTIDFIDEKGGYLDFDGSNDWVACPQPNYDTTGDWSWCMWLNRITASAPSYPLMYGSASNTRVFWYISDGDVKLGIYSEESSGPQPAVNDRFPANEWCMFALKKEGNSLYFCFDADYWTEYTRSSSNWGSVEFIWTNIGEGLGYFWHGYIASVHMYNRAISFDEVKQNYEATKSRFVPRITKSGMFASWDAGDPASYPGGTTLKDTANNYDGTFVNNGSGADISFDSANGGSLVFDGSDDYVNITTLPNCSSLARSAIIWVAVDDWPTSDVPQTPFQSAADQFDISFGVTLNAIYFNGGGSTASTAQKYVTLSPVPADGAWICWAMTIDSSGDIVAMYRNGVALTASGTSAGFSIKNKTTIGCRINTDNTTVQNPLDGKVGSVRLYTKTLSAAEVMENYQATRARFGL